MKNIIPLKTIFQEETGLIKIILMHLFWLILPVILFSISYLTLVEKDIVLHLINKPTHS